MGTFLERKRILSVELDKLIESARQENDSGGYEDGDSVLHPGWIDFDEFKVKVAALINEAFEGISND